MSSHSLHSSAPILLVGAGPTSPNMVTKAFSYVETVVAADGGYHVATESGVPVDLVVGDGDSLRGKTGLTPFLDQSEDQNSTDFEKCLAVVSAPVILGVGFLGGRLDHQMAAFSAILKDPRPIVLLSETELAFIVPQTFKLDLPLGVPLSLYPLVNVRGTTAGIKYPLKDAVLAPDGLISTSNESAGEVAVETDRRGLLCSLPSEHLVAVMAALRAWAWSQPPKARQ